MRRRWRGRQYLFAESDCSAPASVPPLVERFSGCANQPAVLQAR
jgi:hypothetical protein